MHIEEFKTVEKLGFQLGVGTSNSGSRVLFYASTSPSSVEIIENERYIAFSTLNDSRLLSLLNGEENLSGISSTFTEDFSLVAINKSNKETIALRRRGQKNEMWHYNNFPGFIHVLDSDSSADPIVLDASGNFSLFLSKLWENLDNYQTLEVDLESGKRVFKR